jgi:hypothetical protein
LTGWLAVGLANWPASSLTMRATCRAGSPVLSTTTTCPASSGGHGSNRRRCTCSQVGSACPVISRSRVSTRRRCSATSLQRTSTNRSAAPVLAASAAQPSLAAATPFTASATTSRLADSWSAAIRSAMT